MNLLKNLGGVILTDELIEQLKKEYKKGEYATKREIKNYVFEFLRGKNAQNQEYIWNKICG
jgi:hypothetical protein